MRVDFNFWNGKSVLITGHTGFKGTWLSKILLNLGARVSGFSLEPENKPNIFSIAQMELKMHRHIIGDVAILSDIEDAFFKVKPDVLFHLAAQPLVSFGYDEPLETFSTNVMGTANVLSAARSMGAGAPIIVISSDKCYLNTNNERPFVETDHLGGLDPYSASKACTEIVADAFRNSYFSNESKPCLATARAGNVVGGGDWANNRLIPDVMRAYEKNKSISLRIPQATRPWQFVAEPLVGYLFLAQALNENRAFQGAWNFGPYDLERKSVLQLTKSICKTWEHPPKINIAAESFPHSEAINLSVDPTKALTELGWKVRLSFDEIVTWTTEWYNSYFSSRESANFVFEKQIKEYINRVNCCND